MIDIFFDYFGYDKEHHFVAGIAYEYVIILNLISRIITINKNNIVAFLRFVHFMLGDNGFSVRRRLWDLVYLRELRSFRNN